MTPTEIEAGDELTYMGKPLSEMTRAELEDALITMARLYNDAIGRTLRRHRAGYSPDSLGSGLACSGEVG
jgi:hypothetical protein